MSKRPARPVIVSAVGIASGVGSASAVGTAIAAAKGVAGVGKKKRGRPKGTRARAKIDDSAALAVMKQIADATGETNPRELARRAIDSGAVKLNAASRESVIRRLAGRRAPL